MGKSVEIVRGMYDAIAKGDDARFAHLWEVAGDKAVRFQQYTDTAQWLEAAGT